MIKHKRLTSEDRKAIRAKQLKIKAEKAKAKTKRDK